MVTAILPRSYADMTKSQRDSLLGKLPVPGSTVRLLTNASKMPAPTFSLPAGKGAGKACPWSTTEGEDSICGSCYAQKGNYRYIAVENAAQVRYTWTLEALRSPEGMSRWVETMVSAIEATGTRYFRWHDSGDIFSPVYAHMMLQVIQRTPDVAHWIPTRAYRAPWVAILRMIAAEPNATLRPSALHFNELPPVINGLHAGSGASNAHSNCPAPSQENACQDCRKCWNDKQTVVMYHKH
jgi:hypothetical protein